MKRQRTSGFSLVELTLALGVASFCLLAVFGLMPLGVQTNRNANSQTAAANIMAAVVADLRGVSRVYDPSKTYYPGDQVFYSSNCYEAKAVTTGNLPTNTTYWNPGFTCPQFAISFGTDRCVGCSQPPLYFNSTGGVTSLGVDSRYQLDMTFPTAWNSANPNLYGADLKVTWPPNVLQISPAPVPSGSAEMFAVFDRN